MAGLTTTGLQTKRYQEILDDIKESLYRDISPNLDVSEDSQLGLFLASVCRALADAHEILSEIYDGGTIDKAEGFSLDDVTALNAVYRYVAQATRGQAEFTGTSGSPVPSTTRLRSTAGNIFYPVSTFTLTPSYCVEANLEVNSLRTDSNYVIIIDNVEYSYQPTSSDTVTTLLQHLADSINGGLVAKAEVVNDGSVLKIYKDTGDIVARTNPMVVTATTFLTFTKITTINDVVAEQTGALPTLAGTLIEIETTVDGLDGVFNRYDLVTGRDEESDTELRQRYLESLAVTGVGTLDAIVAAVKRVQGVSDASGVENDTETTSSGGLPPKSFKIVVVGGQNDNVAQAIWDAKPAGIRAYGSIFGTAYDLGDLPHNVYFSRPMPKYVFVKVKYSMYDEESLNIPEQDIHDRVVQGINAYGRTLKVGNDVIPNRIYGYVYDVIQGIEINEIKVALANNQSVPPADDQYTTARITVDGDQYTVWESSQYTITKE
ncbi:hypothetical protein [Escherichia phage pEC-M719-6WT.1]|uniref:Baseplate protein J-like domain-containing protein n=1 Tax=Escherichia phage pEC-M719-6WT.1 TaxID=3056220 RepID=A0AA51U663_9CAUD|nr:hypothetical protein [Escherichia phage pEC-M719-6WT.1]